MTFYELAQNRYSERRFADTPVAQEKLERILDAGRLAPTGVNWQPQRLLVIRSAEGMEKLKACTPFTYGAPAAILVCYDRNAAWKSPEGRSVGPVDATLVLSHMMFEAEELGVRTLIVAGYHEELLRQSFCVPDFLEPVAILMIGNPSERSRPHPKLHFERKPQEETVRYETYEGLAPAEDLSATHKIL